MKSMNVILNKLKEYYFNAGSGATHDLPVGILFMHY
jgi:hypothetical protein